MTQARSYARINLKTELRSTKDTKRHGTRVGFRVAGCESEPAFCVFPCVPWINQRFPKEDSRKRVACRASVLECGGKRQRHAAFGRWRLGAAAFQPPNPLCASVLPKRCRRCQGLALASLPPHSKTLPRLSTTLQRDSALTPQYVVLNGAAAPAKPQDALLQMRRN